MDQLGNESTTIQAPGVSLRLEKNPSSKITDNSMSYYLDYCVDRIVKYFTIRNAGIGNVSWHVITTNLVFNRSSLKQKEGSRDVENGSNLAYYALADIQVHF